MNTQKMRKFYIDKRELEPGLRNPIVFLAQGLGSGSIYPFPGTWGTVAGLLIYLGLSSLLPAELWISWVLAACALGIPLCSYAERNIGMKDPHSVVWDEWCGIWVAFVLVPFSWVLVIIGFVLFRILDTKKPWLIGMAEKKLKAGAGIMMDDILTGICVNVILQVLAYLAMNLGIPLP